MNDDDDDDDDESGSRDENEDEDEDPKTTKKLAKRMFFLMSCCLPDRSLFSQLVLNKTDNSKELVKLLRSSISITMFVIGPSFFMSMRTLVTELKTSKNKNNLRANSHKTCFLPFNAS